MLSPASSVNNEKNILINEIEVLFPEITEDKINTAEFLDAARGVVRIVGIYVHIFVVNSI